MSTAGVAFQKCINPDCGFAVGGFKCPECGELLGTQYNWDRIKLPKRLSDFGKRWANRNNPLDFSGVWRFRELLNFCEDKCKVTIGEEQTILQQNDAVAEYVNVRPGQLYLQYEGLNPSGSFKDNGMTAAFSDVTVNYHKENRGEFSNSPVEAPNDINEIIKLIK